MGRVIDLLYGAYDEIKLNGKLLMDYECMMNIFMPLHDDLPEFQEYMEYFFEQKESNVIGSLQPTKTNQQGSWNR